ncbi:MAG: hypothetical protein NC218_02420 [Acetobacter sp.]|nr:hypothetical protein [Acetobacter sp.]
MDSILQNDLTIFRYYASEQLDMYGISALYYQPKPGKHFTVAGEISANYFDPIPCKILFDQVPKISTLKKLGWVTELDQEASLINVHFDTPGIQQGALYEVKDPLKPDAGRLFRVTKLQTGILYPAFVTCQIVPVVGSEPEETVKPYEGDKSIFLDTSKLGEIDEY